MFNINDKVKWRPTVNSEVKVGTVVIEVPAGVPPVEVLRDDHYNDYKVLVRSRRPHDHNTFMVAVDNPIGKPLLYHPRIHLIKKL
tara:strand:- start:224 stop:478 length:255 start_codon:yes stop_codon:yes gene_type:complete